MMPWAIGSFLSSSRAVIPWYCNRSMYMCSWVASMHLLLQASFRIRKSLFYGIGVCRQSQVVSWPKRFSKYKAHVVKLQQDCWFFQFQTTLLEEVCLLTQIHLLKQCKSWNRDLPQYKHFASECIWFCSKSTKTSAEKRYFGLRNKKPTSKIRLCFLLIVTRVFRVSP